MCDMRCELARYQTRVVVTRMLPTMLNTHTHTHTYIQNEQLLANRRGVSQSKITVSEADSTDSKLYGSANNYNNTSEQVH